MKSIIRLSSRTTPGRVLNLLLSTVVSFTLLTGCIGDNTIEFGNISNDDDEDSSNNSTATGQIFAVTESNRLISFEEDTPGSLDTNIAISGLNSGESITGIDFRPETNDLYAATDQGRYYIVDADDGDATIDSTADTPPNGATFGIDFNPVADRLRQLSDADQNLNIDVDNGNTQNDSALVYAAGDTNVGTDPTISAAAYTNSFRDTTTTTLYAIDSNLDILATFNSIQNGTLSTIGSLGFDTSESTALDIEANGRAFASLNSPNGTTSSLYSINLSTGAATLIGEIAGGEVITGLAVETPRTPVVFAISNANLLISFNPSTPDTLNTSVNVTGLFPGEQIVDIDFRPETGELVAFTTLANLYTLNTSSGIATLSTTLDTTPAGTFFGIDFDAVRDRLRIVSDTTDNLRVDDVEDNETDTDDSLEYDSGDDNDGATPNVVAVGHTNSFVSANTTIPYVIDSGLDILAQLTSPGNGELQTVGDLNTNTSGFTGFDIAGNDGLALAAFNAPGATFSQLFTLDLETGEATLVDNISNINIVIVGLTILLPRQ